MNDKDNKNKNYKKQGDDEMEKVLNRESYNIKDKLKILSLKTKGKRMEMKQCKCTKKDSVVNKELADIQKYIYKTIK